MVVASEQGAFRRNIRSPVN